MDSPRTSTQVKFRLPVGQVLLALAPLLLLGVVIATFLLTNGAGLNIQPAAPIETVQFTHTLLRPGEIEITLQNTSPADLTIAQLVINDAFWPFEANPTQTLARLQAATLSLRYPWVEGEAYEISLLTSNGVRLDHSIPVATATRQPGGGSLLSFTLIGLYVGVIPVFLGMAWFPILKQLGRRWIMFLMAITAGLLIYLGVDATNEALEQAAALGSPFQGVGLIATAALGTILLLLAVSRRQATAGKDEASQRMTLALMIAIGIGLHNLGEGLAIGAAYSAGAAALGTFLVIGFIIQNITEGLGIVAPVLKDRPALSFLAFTGLVGGGPAILGAWAGGSFVSPWLSVLFLSIGAGAVFEVVFEVGKMLQKDLARHGSWMLTFAGVMIGMLMLYLTGIWIK